MLLGWRAEIYQKIKSEVFGRAPSLRLETSLRQVHIRTELPPPA